MRQDTTMEARQETTIQARQDTTMARQNTNLIFFISQDLHYF